MTLIFVYGNSESSRESVGVDGAKADGGDM